MYHGLMIAWMEGHRKVAVTVDSSAVLTLVSREPERTNPPFYIHSNGSLVNFC